MPNLETSEFQPSLTEWFAAIGKTDEAQALRLEDNSRTARFAALREVVDFPADVPHIFEAAALANQEADFASLLQQNGDQLCAIRLIPKHPGLPKLRNRGLSLKQCYQDWFLTLAISPQDYQAEIYRHCGDQLWSATFVVNHSGMAGEIIAGQHNQLTKGDTKSTPIRFWHDGYELQGVGLTPEITEQLHRMIAAITIKDSGQRTRLSEKVSATFWRDWLIGYFETTIHDTGELFYIDYNRLLATVILPPRFTPTSETDALIKGFGAFPGIATGRVRFVAADSIANTIFNQGDILVTENTDVRYLPLMKLAGAIITQRGGILSHAAIVARELKIPCIVGVRQNFDSLQDGDQVVVDANSGLIIKK